MNAMSKTVITVRIDSNKRDMVKGKCDKARISMNQLFERLCDLIINDSIKVTEKGISLGGTEEKETSDNEDTHSLLMQIAVINERLNKLENIVGNECRINAVNECSVSEQDMNADNAVIMNEEPIKEETTKESTLSKCPNLPLNEELGDKVPNTELTANNGEIPVNDTELANLNAKQKDILERMKGIESGETFKSQGELARSLKVGTAEISTLKKYWEDKIFSVTQVGNSNQLVKL